MHKLKIAFPNYSPHMVTLIYLYFVSVPPSIAKMVVLHKAFPP
jgi:hypothetical protein